MGACGWAKQRLARSRLVNRCHMLSQVINELFAARAAHRAQSARYRAAEAAERDLDTGCRRGQRRCVRRDAHVMQDAAIGSQLVRGVQHEVQ